MAQRHLLQTATWWSFTGDDGYGGYNFDAPIKIACRWEDVNERFINAEGIEVPSNAVIYTDRAVKVGDFMVQGDYTSIEHPNNVTAAGVKPLIIRRYGRTTDLRNVQNIHKVYL